jgi:RNA polymerase sigma factor (sigma-70 family)
MTQLADADLVNAAQGGDREALASLYERYFDAVYDFAARMVRDRDEAADIAQETFLKAMNGLGGLKQGASFRGWLFSIARNTALNRLERRGRTRPLTTPGGDGEELALDVVDTSRFSSPQEAAEAAAAARLVWEAASALDPRQLSLLDLHVRQGLDAEEIAQALGITRNNAYVLLHRLKKAVESAIAAYVLWKQAGERCDGLAAVLAPAAAGGALTPAIRREVDRHVERCADCRERRRKLAPLAVFGALAPVAPPPGVRAAGLEQLLRQPRPPAPARREPPGQPKQPPGGPARDAHHGLTSPQFLRAGALLGVAAGLLLLALVLPFSPLALTRDDGNGLRMGAPAGETPRPGGSSTIIIPVSPSAAATATAGAPGSPAAPPSPSPGGAPGGTAPTPTATPGPATPTAAATATPTTAPSPGVTATATPTASPTPCTPAIGLPPGTGGLTIPAGGQASFQLQNATGCPAGFSLAYGAAWLVGPAGGTVPAFGSVTVTLRVDAGALPAEEGDYPTTVTVTGPANSFTLPVTARRGGQPPQLLSASASCSGGSRPMATFTAEAADDIAVVRVTVAFAGENGPVTLDLGHAGGTLWTLGTQTSLAGVTQVTFTAYDGAGRTAARAVAPVGCGGQP